MEWRRPCRVESVESVENAEASGAGYRVCTSAGVFEADALVVATGGLSVPKIGATAFGYKVAEQFGLAVVPPRPALVPLAFDAAELARYGELSGISLEAVVSAGAGQFREDLLFTHRGLSGPAILQVSSYWTPGEALHIDLLQGHDAEQMLFARRTEQALPASLLAHVLPRRFAQQWCAAMDATRPLAECSDRALVALAAHLHDWQVKPSGTTGYQKAEVTLGGVDTHALSSRTMEANDRPGLYFIGEVVDVTGHLGGFNFQWAWASGHAAGGAL